MGACRRRAPHASHSWGDDYDKEEPVEPALEVELSSDNELAVGAFETLDSDLETQQA